jgi:hypothetical protein
MMAPDSRRLQEVGINHIDLMKAATTRTMATLLVRLPVMLLCAGVLIGTEGKATLRSHLDRESTSTCSKTGLDGRR